MLVVAGCLLAVADSPGTFREQASVYCQVAQSAIKVPLPEIHQPDYYSCGAAALMSIGSYFGVGPEDIEAWKTDLCTRTDTGTDVEPIVEYARNKLMLDVTLVERDMTDEQLRASLDAGKPVICPIQAYGEPAEYEKLNENGHYVVAIGYDRVNVYFMDPKLTGRRGFLSWPEFHRRWHENIGTDSNPDVRAAWESSSGRNIRRCHISAEPGGSTERQLQRTQLMYSFHVAMLPPINPAR